MSERFSVTYWPGGAQPIPPVHVPERVEREGDWLALAYHPASGYQALPDEFHLRECRDVDLDDLDAVCDLVRRFGSPVPVGGGTDDLPGRADVAIERWAVSHGRPYGKGFHPPKEPLAEWVHVDEVMYRLRVLRQLSAHALAYRRGDYVADVWPKQSKREHAETIKGLQKLSKGSVTEDDPRFVEAIEAHAWGDFVDYADLALRPFHVRVWVNVGHPSYDIGTPHPTLYEAAVLQIVNDLAEDVDYRDCPHCHRTFGRQVGRAKQGQNRRTGVTYCSPSCASAARVRAYRARKRDERKV